MIRRVCLLMSLGLAGCAAAAPPPAALPAHLEIPPCPSPASPGTEDHAASPSARSALAIVRGLHSSDRKKTYDAFGEGFRKAIPVEEVERIAVEEEKSMGTMVRAEVAEERQDEPGGMHRLSVVGFFERGASLYKLSLDDQGILRGIQSLPLDPNPRVSKDQKGPADDYQSKHLYALPLVGKWFVGNGGRDPKQNHHVGNEQQWYALDLHREGTDHKSFRTDGKKVEDYLAWNELVVAPADGTVVQVVDGAPDNAPGDKDGYVVPGNAVVIDHGDGEFSVLAHLRLGSIVVKVGKHLKKGDRIGRVGNSGNTSEPHLHWHLASEANMTKSHGLPIRFAPLLLDDKATDSASPVRGDSLEMPH